MNRLTDELSETLEYLSLLINIELSDDVVLDLSHCELLIKVRNQIDELNRIIITKELNNIRESL
jgi:hypothetical protein